MKISYNAPAMRASNALNASDNRVSQSLTRLSSGLKVTASKDNPSGYAIGRRMNTQITGLGTATQSSQNGISVIETADGALTEVHEMLQRMNGLAVKGETGTLTSSDRMTLEQEVKQLKKEIARVASDTQFNGQTLLDGTFDLRGYTNNNKIRVDYYSDEVMAKVYSISALSVAYDGEGKIDKDATTLVLGPEFPTGVEISETTETKITLTGPLDFKMTIEIPKDADGNAVSGNILEKDPVTVPAFNVTYNYTFNTQASEWQAGPLTTDFEQQLQAAIAAGTTDIPEDARVHSSVYDEANGQWNIIVRNDSGFQLAIPAGAVPPAVPDTNPPALTQPANATVEVGGGQATPTQDLLIDITGIGAMDTQTGANEGQQLAIRIPTISLGRMNLEDLTLKSDTSEEDSIKASAEANRSIKSAILYVSDARSRLGAYQNRLEHTVNNLAVSNENMTASYSRIMDVDMAEEMTNYTTEQVISQAAVSMLAQANERPAQVLQLLQ